MDFIETSETDEVVLKLLSLNLKFQGLNKALESKHGLSIVQWAFMKTLLHMPAVSPQGLAKALNVTPGTLTQTANRLLKKGYVFGCSDPSDARKKMLSLTRHGKEALDSIDKHYDLIFSEMKTVKNEIVAVGEFLNKTRYGFEFPASSLQESFA